MGKVKVQVATHRPNELPKDWIVNAVYFDVAAMPGVEADWMALALDVRNAFKSYRLLPANYGCEAKIYDMGEAEPRKPKATTAWEFADRTAGVSAPREVALCLSYFSEANRPRFRGRLYLGPWGQAVERPSADDRADCIALATKLGAIGGVNVDWHLYSPTRAAYSKITAGWVDDEWDTVRSRGMKATKRDTYKTAE
jgi:hypothetical protein